MTRSDSSHQLLISKQVPPNGEETLSLVNLKAVVQRMLPSSSTARSLILAEKDWLPAREALAKFEVYDRLLSKELKPFGPR